MPFINAFSLAPDVKTWLANSQHPRILHVFDRACNLINEWKEVLSLVTPQIGNGPFNLVVADEVCFSDHLSLESPIVNSPNQLTLDDITINTTDAKLWNPRPDWQRLHAHREHIRSQVTSSRITNYLNVAGFDAKRLNRRGLPITDHKFSSSLLSNLSSAIATNDTSSALSLTSQLAGLGVGLTPAGDDFMMGAIYAAWIIHPVEVASVVTKEIADAAAPLTTSLSATWLRSAGRGEAGALWHTFFDVLLSGDAATIQVQIDKLLSIGHTSGADALSGFINVFTGWIENQPAITAIASGSFLCKAASVQKIARFPT